MAPVEPEREPPGAGPVVIRNAGSRRRTAIVRILTDSFRDFPPLAMIVGVDAGADDRRRRMMQATLAAPP